jgi:hypothetical protein
MLTTQRLFHRGLPRGRLWRGATADVAKSQHAFEDRSKGILRADMRGKRPLFSRMRPTSQAFVWNAEGL